MGTGAQNAAKLGKMDPTMMVNGIYALRLTSTTSDGVASAVLDISVEKNLKVGNFTVSFSDVSVPVAGLPIEVIRTYDSRDKASGDFGVGWNVSLRDIRGSKPAASWVRAGGNSSSPASGRPTAWCSRDRASSP